jgi:hypothetical protein
LSIPVTDRLSTASVNIVCGLIAYCHQPKKPAIAIDHNLLSAA